MADYFMTMPAGLTAKFTTVCEIGPKEILQLGAYVPGLNFVGPLSQKAVINIHHAMSENTALEDYGSTVRITTRKSDSLPADLYHLIYGIQRRELIKHGFYTVHGACVGHGDDYTLIIGHSGAGKTTVAHNLVEHHGLQLFSGNKTVVHFAEGGDIKAVAGTKTMTALDKNQNRFSYEMEQGRYETANKVPITSIIIVRVNDGVEELQILSPASALHTLYPYFMDSVNADVIVNDGDVLDGSPDWDEKVVLSQNLSTALNHIKVHKISGSIDFLTVRTLSP